MLAMFDFTEEQNQYLDRKEAFLDNYIDQDDEQALFISSYIHGHFSVSAAKLSHLSTYPQSDTSSHQLAAENADIAVFAKRFERVLRDDIQSALANNELSAADAAAVEAMLNDMFNT